MDSQDTGEDIPFYHSSSTSLAGEDLNELLKALDGSESIIPSSVVAHFLAVAGCNITDPNVLKMVAFSTQNFLTQTIQDAKAHRELVDPNDNRTRLVTTSNVQYALRAQGKDVTNVPYLVSSNTSNTSG